MSVKLGIEVFLSKHVELVKDKNVGIITNQTGILSDLTLNVDRIVEEFGSLINLKAIFAPEQGFRGNEQAGFSSGGYEDPQTKIMVHQLYERTPEQIYQIFEEAEIDVILYDIQDVGARFYTYIWTMADVLEAIAGSSKELIVLDRPNPLGGLQVDGPVVKPGFESFVGRYGISLIHGLTTGELAHLFNSVFVPQKLGKKAKIEVIWMEGWSRSMLYEDTGLPFIFPSINLPTLTSVKVYPGQGLFEGLDVSEGRGTTHPFEIIGAPFMDYKLSKTLNAKKVPGTHYMESHFTPVFSYYANELCSGVQVFITDYEKYNTLRSALEIITTYRDLYKGRLQFLKTFEVICGSAEIKNALIEGKSTEEIIAGWSEELEQFKELRKNYIHYN